MTEAEKWQEVAKALAERLSFHNRKPWEETLNEVLKLVISREKRRKKKGAK